MRLLQKTLQDKQLQPLLLILAVFAAAKVAFLLRYHLPIWDEAVYLGMGKYIYSLGSSGLWEILRPPALPLVTGIFWKLGLPYVLFSEVVTVLFGVGVVFLSYLIANKLFNRKVAILAAALLATSPWFFLYSSYILTEVPSAFFALLAIYTFISRRYFLSGAAAGAAMLFKFPNGLVLAVIAAAIFSAIVKKRLWQSQLLQLAKVLLAFVFVTLPFFAFNYLFYRPFTSNAYDAIFRPLILGAWHQSNPSKAVASQLYNYSFYLVEAFRQHFVFVFFLAAAVLFWKRKWFNDAGKLLMGIFGAAYLAYFSYIPNKDERFLVLFLPAICIFSAASFIEIFLRLRQRLSATAAKGGVRKYVLRLAAVAVASLLILSFAVAAYKDYHFYSWRPSSEPVVASELYRSISSLGIKGAVLTSEPVFAAYNGNRFFPYYFTSYEGFPQELKALNEWEQGKAFEAVIYSPQTLFCPVGDFECETAKANMLSYLQSNFKQALNGTYYDGQLSYYVFVNESLYRKS